MPAPRQVSDRQWEILLEYLETDRALAVGQLCNSGLLAKQTAATKWDELAVRLNSLGVGVTKSGAKWRDYWNNQKYAVRKKASEMRVHTLGTGGGPGKKGILTALEERVLAIIGKIAVHGNESVRNTKPVTDSTKSSFSQEPVSVPASASGPSTLREPAHFPSEACSSPLQTSDGPDDEFPPVFIIGQSNVPQWALDIETRRVAAMEQQAQALKAISAQIQQQTALLQLMAANNEEAVHLLRVMANNPG